MLSWFFASIERACAFVFTRSLQRKFLSLMSYLPLFEIELSKTSPSSIRSSFSVLVRPSYGHYFCVISHHRDVFSYHFTSFVMYFLPILHHSFHCLAPLYISFLTSNNHSFFSHLFQVWLYQMRKRNYSSYLDVLGLTITYALLSHFNQSLIASRKVIDSVRR